MQNIHHDDCVVSVTIAQFSYNLHGKSLLSKCSSFNKSEDMSHVNFSMFFLFCFCDCWLHFDKIFRLLQFYLLSCECIFLQLAGMPRLSWRIYRQIILDGRRAKLERTSGIHTQFASFAAAMRWCTYFEGFIRICEWKLLM